MLLMKFFIYYIYTYLLLKKGTPANMCVYSALLNPHDRIMGLNLSHGGQYVFIVYHLLFVFFFFF